MTMLALENVNWSDRLEAIDAFRWYGNLAPIEQQMFVNGLTVAEMEFLSKTLLAAFAYTYITGTDQFKLAVLENLTERLTNRAQFEGLD